jgi:hypothetical protein
MREGWPLVEENLEHGGMPIGWVIPDGYKLVEGELYRLPLASALLEGEFDTLPLGSALSVAELEYMREGWPLVEG